MTLTWILALFVVSVSGGSLENRLRRQLGDDCQLLNWQPFNGNEYGFFDHTKSFTAAEGICMRCQATVASVTSNEELTFLRNLVPHGTPFWLGATDRGTEGQFEWLDGSAMTFTNWKHGEPDNQNTDESNQADCAYVNANGLWRDNHCDLDNKRFVCKKRGVVATTTAPPATTAPLVMTTVLSQSSAAPAVEPAPSAEGEGSEPTFQILPVFVTDGPQPLSASKAPENNYKRTVVLMQKTTQPGEYVFFRGGVDHSMREGCTADADSSNCAIPIDVRHENLNISSAYDAWRAGDRHLDWYGREKEQGDFQGWLPQGSPGLWTTNDASDTSRFHPLNTYGPHYWLLDMDMDCSKTQDGYFEVKAFMSDASAWERDIYNNQCQGVDTFPFTSTNHIARCGALNVFHYDEGRCEIRDL